MPFNGARDESPASKGARFILAKPPGVNVCARSHLRERLCPLLDMKPPRATPPMAKVESTGRGMRKTGRWRSGTFVAMSVLGHAGILVILGTNLARPRPYEPDPVFEVTIAPRGVVVPRVAARSRQQLRPRPSRLRPDNLSVEPLFAPQALPPTPPAPTPPSLTPGLSAALRRGLGCANITTLSREERDGCLERLGAEADKVAPLPLGMPAGKQRAFDAAAAHKAACRKYREGMPPGLQPAGETGMPAGLGAPPPLRDGGAC